MKRFTNEKLISLCKQYGREVDSVYDFDYEIPKTKFDGKDLKAWKNKKYKGEKGTRRVPKGYHKKESVTIELSLFHIYK